jgi:hypothetical protein
MLPRSDVFGTDWQDEALQVAEFVIAHDPRVANHLQ